MWSCGEVRVVLIGNGFCHSTSVTKPWTATFWRWQPAVRPAFGSMARSSHNLRRRLLVICRCRWTANRRPNLGSTATGSGPVVRGGIAKMLYATWNRLRKQKVSETPPLPLPRRDPPVQETRWIWFWDDQKKVMDGYWTDGPPLEPPGFRPNSYHSHYELPPDWLFPRGRRYSWWDGRAR
jgi:hypothetical protein